MDTEINFSISSRIRQSMPNIAMETQSRYETMHGGEKKQKKYFGNLPTTHQKVSP